MDCTWAAVRSTAPGLGKLHLRLGVHESAPVCGNISCPSREGTLLLVQTFWSIYCAPCLESELAEADSNARCLFCGPSVLMEMRRELRYRLGAPALFFWQSAHHRRLRGEGSTRDVSVLGAFIVTATCPPVETPVQVELVLPSPMGTKTDIRIRGEARVIRVEHPSGGQGENGFAVVREDLNHWGLATSQTESEASVAGDICLAGKMDHE